MRTLLKRTRQSQPLLVKSSTTAADDILHHLAFDNSFQANIITLISSGKILAANSAACKLLGYSKKELLTKTRSAIFDIKDNRFKQMLKQRTAEGRSAALVTAIKKGGRTFVCEITSAVFMDGYVQKAITTIADMSRGILKQKNIDIRKEKIVAENIVIAKSKQKDIDTKKKKKVAANIILAKSKQKGIDAKKEKIVADNIVIAKSKQRDIDTKKERIVAGNIILAKSKQKDIDAKKRQDSGE